MADKGRCELMERKEMTITALIAESQSPEVVEPCQRRFHYPACSTQAASVGVILWARQQFINSSGPGRSTVCLPTVGTVSYRDCGIVGDLAGLESAEWNPATR